METSSLKKNIYMILIALKLHIKKIKYFKVDYGFMIISNIIQVLIMIVFWDSLYNNNLILPNWDWSHLMIFTAFSEMFFGLKSSFTMAGSRFWTLIVSGKLDSFLVRPIDSRFHFIIRNFRPEFLIRTIPSIFILITISGLTLKPMAFLFGIIVCGIGVILLTLIELCIGYTAFKYGKVDAINELIDSLLQFNSYPLTIFGKVLTSIFTFIIPFMFFSTIPSQIGTNMLGSKELIMAILSLLFVSSIWLGLDNFLWRKGIENYESYNG